jgi:hypothetical protein
MIRAPAPVEPDINVMRDALKAQAREIELLTSALCEARSGGATASAPDYRRTLDELRLAAAACIPQGSTVAVASRGDDAALELHGLRAWHFPRAADGAWSAQYPADGAGAVARLAAVQREGAQFLVLPWSAFWWLESYPALAAHLDRQATLIHRDAACAIYRLASERSSGRPPSDAVAYRHLFELLDALTPDGAGVLVLDSPPPPPQVEIPLSRTISFVPDLGAALQTRGASYLAIPDVPTNATARADQIRRDAAEQFVMIASRAGVGELFELNAEVRTP